MPESLACPPSFVLRDGVCASCNNSLGHIDQALLHEFEILTFINGIGRKGGRPPSIDSWTSIAAAKGTNGPEIYVNAGPETIQALGKKLPAAKASNGISNVTFSGNGNIETVTFDQQFGAGPKFVRAVYKVALGSIAYFLGLEAVYESKYNGVRAFVREGIGDFRVLMLERQDTLRNCFGPPWTTDSTPHPIVGMTILGITFIADMDPEQRGMAHIRAVAPKEDRFVILPLISSQGII